MAQWYLVKQSEDGADRYVRKFGVPGELKLVPKELASRYPENIKQATGAVEGYMWERVRALRWQNALDIQSAVNPSGIALALHEACKECMAEGMGTDAVKEDPAVRLITYHLGTLMQTRYMEESLSVYRAALEICEFQANEAAK